MRDKKDFFTRLGEKLDIPREGLPGGFSVFLTGENEAVVRGCRKILCYEADLISLSVGKKTLLIRGSDLFCSAYGAGAVTVVGRISEISLGEATE